MIGVPLEDGLMPVALVLAVAVLLAGTAPQVARREPGRGQAATVTATIALRAGADAFDVNGPAQCKHAPQASIYGVNAEMWSVQHNDSRRALTMTVWKPSDGSQPMLSLTLSTGGKEARVSTVKGPGGQSQPSGTGTVAYAAEGKGGTFTINATAAGGMKISGTVKCDAFTPLVAEGGDE
jgi:hypothetical protein